MKTLSYEEQQLASLYNASGTRAGLISELTEMRGFLIDEEAELRELTDSTLEKLRSMTDEEYATLDMIPDFGPEGEDAG